MAIGLALSAAVSFGVADFLGGMASRRAAPLPVVAFAQGAGVLPLLVALPLIDGRFGADVVVAGLVAGLAGAGGLGLYFRALAIGPMGLTAPLAAVVGAAVPVVVGLGLGERLSTAAAVGGVVGLAAVVLASVPAGRAAEAGRRTALRGPLLALAGGAAFGLFFIAVDQAPADSGVWPLLVARGAAL